MKAGDASYASGVMRLLITLNVRYIVFVCSLDRSFCFCCSMLYRNPVLTSFLLLHEIVDREVVSIALNYLDRSASHWIEHSEILIAKKEFQLLAVTSLYIAIKVHGETESSEGPRRKLKIDAFYELSRKQFDVKLIESTERHILAVLNWNVNPPTALKYIDAYLSLCPQWDYSAQQVKHASVLGGIYDVARYLTELSVCQSDFCFRFKTSTIAFSSILFAMDTLHSTLPIPYSVRVAFLNNIALATGLVSGNADVLKILEKLKKVCPGMLSGDDVPREAESDDCAASIDDLSSDGKASPVCVMVEQLQGQEAPRKRSRSIDDETWQPIDRPVNI
jgi:Cyclin, N-terminal domain